MRVGNVTDKKLCIVLVTKTSIVSIGCPHLIQSVMDVILSICNILEFELYKI